MDIRTEDDLGNLAQRFNQELGLLAHTGYKRLGRGMVFLGEGFSDDSLLDQIQVGDMPATYTLPVLDGLRDNPDVQDMMQYDPLRQYVVAAEVDDHYLLALQENPSPSPYELFRRKQQTLDRPLKTKADLDALIQRNIDWLATFAFRCHARFGPGVLMITSADTPEILEANERPVESEVGTRINGHTHCLYMPARAFLDYLAGLGDTANLAGQLRGQLASYDPMRTILLGFDNGERTLYTAHTPTNPKHYPGYFFQQAGRRVQAHDAAQEAPAFNRKLDSLDDVSALVEQNDSQLIAFAILNTALHGRGLIVIQSEQTQTIPDTPGDLSFVALDEHNSLSYVRLEDYAASPAAEVAAMQGLYMLLVYNPAIEYVCLLSTGQEGFTRRYRMAGDVGQLRRRVLGEFGIEAEPLDERQYAALRAEIMGVYELLSGLAFKGYKAFGRGAVAILSYELSQEIASGPRRAQLTLSGGQLAFYVPAKELPRLTDVSTWLQNKLNTYEPDESFMALFFHGEGRSSAQHIREVLAPRRAYRKHQAEINALYDQ